MIKSEELKHGTITRAAEDEPLFVLRAKDQLAPAIVRFWAQEAERAGAPRAKVDEALNLAHEMVRWGRKNGAKIPD